MTPKPGRGWPKSSGTIVIPKPKEKLPAPKKSNPNPRAKKQRVVYADYYVDFRERVLAKAAGEWGPKLTKPAGNALIEYPVLYYTKPSENSDKEYRIRIWCHACALKNETTHEPRTHLGYHVEYAHGKRGAVMNFKRKTTEPQSLDKCKAIAEKIIEEKVKGGYTSKFSGTPFSEPLPVTFKYSS